MKVAFVDVVFADKVCDEHDDAVLENVFSRRVQISGVEGIGRDVLRKLIVEKTEEMIDYIYKQMEASK